MDAMETPPEGPLSMLRLLEGSGRSVGGWGGRNPDSWRAAVGPRVSPNPRFTPLGLEWRVWYADWMRG